MRLFGQTPRIGIQPYTNFVTLKKYLNGAEMLRVQQVMNEIVANQSIINHIQHHFTTEENLVSIAASKTLKGNKSLSRSKIFFNPNALGNADLKNGDADVICFCPYLVDFTALTTTDYAIYQTAIKPNLIRMSIDVNKVKHQGQYGQFMKVFDLCSPSISYQVKINEDISLHFHRVFHDKWQFVYLDVTLLGTKQTFKLHTSHDQKELDASKRNKHNQIFYGSLTAMNHFCLKYVTDLITNGENQEFAAAFFQYLANHSNDEIKKILITMAQTITIIAEFNFNHSLSINHNVISAIHFVRDNKTYDVSDLSPEDYQSLLADLSMEKNGKLTNMAATPETLVSSITDANNEKVTSLYGAQMLNGVITVPTVDLTDVPASHFTHGYFETRGGRDLPEPVVIPQP